MEIDFEEDANQPASGDVLARLQQLAAELVDRQSEIEEIEKTLTSKKHELQDLETKRIPDLMNQAGLKDFTLLTGEKMVVNEIVAAPTPNAAGLNWLRNNGADALIKTELTINFPKGSEHVAVEAVAKINAEFPGYPVAVSSTVHAQTLSAWVRERIAKGSVVPEVLRVYQGYKAVVKKGKRNG